jgi:hypothetical protein
MVMVHFRTASCGYPFGVVKKNMFHLSILLADDVP